MTGKKNPQKAHSYIMRQTPNTRKTHVRTTHDTIPTTPYSRVRVINTPYKEHR